MAAGGEQDRTGGWMPPLEARELGAGERAGGRYKLSPLARWLIAAAIGAIALLAIGRVIAVAEGPPANTPDAVAQAFLDARADGDGDRACAQLTPRAQRDMVALVRGVEPPAASASDCQRYVLRSSERSQFTDPALPKLRDRGLRVLHYPGPDGKRYAKIEPEGGTDPFLELRRVAGEWKLDGLAVERVSFMLGCTDQGAARAYCGCLFDKLADRGHASNREMDEIVEASKAGSVPPLVQQFAAACAR